MEKSIFNTLLCCLNVQIYFLFYFVKFSWKLSWTYKCSGIYFVQISFFSFLSVPTIVIMMLSDEFLQTNIGLVGCVGGKVMTHFSFIPDQMKESPAIMMLSQKQVSLTHLGKDGNIFFVLLQPDKDNDYKTGNHTMDMSLKTL